MLVWHLPLSVAGTGAVNGHRQVQGEHDILHYSTTNKMALPPHCRQVFVEDMGFLASQSEILMKKAPTKELYINLKSSDAWMPYHFRHGMVSVPKEAAVVVQVPTGLTTGMATSMLAKEGGGWQASNPTNDESVLQACCPLQGV